MNTKNKLALLGAFSTMLTGCVTAPSNGAVRSATNNQEVSARVYSYPMQGQSSEQQDRDRYECHYWAIRQTGVDPIRRVSSEAEPGTIVPSRAPGELVIAGAATGAIVGAAVSKSRDAGNGAVVGAIIGGVIGAASAEAQQDEEGRISERLSSRSSDKYRQESAEFRRAMSACLEGRGYSVK